VIFPSIVASDLTMYYIFQANICMQKQWSWGVLLESTGNRDNIT